MTLCEKSGLARWTPLQRKSEPGIAPELNSPGEHTSTALPTWGFFLSLFFTLCNFAPSWALQLWKNMMELLAPVLCNLTWPKPTTLCTEWENDVMAWMVEKYAMKTISYCIQKRVELNLSNRWTWKPFPISSVLWKPNNYLTMISNIKGILNHI